MHMEQPVRSVVVGVILMLAAAGCAPGARPGEASGDAAAVRTPSERAATEQPEHGMTDEDMPMGSEPDDTAMGHDADEHDAQFSFGAPADAADADRTLDVETTEDGGFHYEPSSIDVSAGEVVTFRIHNVGQARHEFVLGDRVQQQDHEAEMRRMASEGDMMMHDDPNAVAVEPGETKELTWRFTTPGDLEYGCHEPGHYAAGMHGDVTVSP
jgi:uncharacterized cupredoxin-like copper-binding protein